MRSRRLAAALAIRAAWDETERILRALNEETSAHGAHLVIVYVPSRMEVSDEDLEATRAWYGLDESVWGRAPVIRELTRISNELGFPLLDLTPALRRAQVLGTPYYAQDGHWNARGHRVAADELRQFLREQGRLPACSGSGG